jgi:hypothetical protein
MHGEKSSLLANKLMAPKLSNNIPVLKKMKNNDRRNIHQPSISAYVDTFMKE